MSTLWQPATESSALEGRSFLQGRPCVQPPPCRFCGCRGAARGDGLGRRVRTGLWGQWCAVVFTISLALSQSSARVRWKLCGARYYRRRGSTACPWGLRCNLLRLRAVWGRPFVHRGLRVGGLTGRHMLISPSWQTGEMQLLIPELLDVINYAVDKLALDWEADAA